MILGGGMFVEIDGIWFLHGIVSAGIIVQNCPKSGYSIMTKVSEFINWIEPHVIPFTFELNKGR